MPRTIPIKTVDQLGELIRAVRKQQQLRQDEVGQFSHSFIGEVENGKPTAQVGKILDLLQELGIALYLEVPAGIDPGGSAMKRSRRKA
jgi:transcriptional regulator with XRE-family HTH domain